MSLYMAVLIKIKPDIDKQAQEIQHPELQFPFQTSESFD